MLCATFCVFIEACGNEKVETSVRKKERDYRRGETTVVAGCTCAYAVRSSRGKCSYGTMLPTMGSTISRRRAEARRGEARAGENGLDDPRNLYTAFSPLSFLISPFPSKILTHPRAQMYADAYPRLTNVVAVKSRVIR